MAARVAPADPQQLHHFVSTSPWPTAPLEDELVKVADRLVGGADAVLVVDDTALVKQGRHSVGVKRQYCGELGKRGNCQALVLLTLARAEVPVGVGLRLFLPEDWCDDAERRAARGVPEAITYRPKWAIALDEIDRVLASSTRFGCVLADAEYGKAAEFRHGLSERSLPWAVGSLPTQKLYPAEVTLAFPERKPTGRPRKHPVPSAPSVPAAELIKARPAAFRTISWRNGTKGPLRAAFAALKVRPTGQSRPGLSISRVMRPGSSASTAPTGSGSTISPPIRPPRRSKLWPLCSRRAGSASRCTSSSRMSSGATISTAGAGVACTTTRSCASSLSPFCRTCGSGGKSARTPPKPGPPPQPSLPAIRRRILAALTRILLRCPHCRQRFAHHLRL